MRRAAAVLLATLAGGAGMASERTPALAEAIAATLAEPLTASSPNGLRIASALLNRMFAQGTASAHDPARRREHLDGYVAVQKALLQHALDSARHQPEDANAYKSAAIPMSYNLAANTWIGWGAEAAGPITMAHQRVGLAAARLNVELAAALGLGPERRRNGAWMLGAQLLAAADYEGAAAAFATSRTLARESGDPAATLMAQGWIHVAAILGAGGPDARRQLGEVKARLETLAGDGPFYAAQFETAIAALRAAAPPE